MSTTDTIKLMMWAFIAVIIATITLSSCGLTDPPPQWNNDRWDQFTPEENRELEELIRNLK
jgi:hypothetical protein